LFEAIRLLGERPATYLIVGTGRQEEEIKLEAERLGVAGKLRFLGMRRDIPALLQAADIFAFPTLQEGFSNALIEAMAAGCAIVASDYPSNFEAVTHENSALISRRLDAHALAANLARLYEDLDLRCRLAAAARSRAETEFSVAANALKTANLYEELWQLHEKDKA
jgi:glycosyltransferase involved in cell wall biosynthesis